MSLLVGMKGDDMSKPILDFAAIRTITSNLNPAEIDLSGAIAANAELMASIIRAGRPMNISPSVTHDMVAVLSQANADLVAGMGKTIEVHALLADLRDRLGLKAIAFGGGMWKGDILTPEAQSGDGMTGPVRLAASS
ncbi:hypothetical protein Q4F19_17300 [Sphingomonas sp. BIUV-7]|uniref:Uncharacterized protein n=1 Tax=Sphingomonas natans TaxID=3063330 RepID=A0ABT8YCR6_9SPHN|nr:hypothetical protein [Sphingomonas sp. BIUV-7]MDO6416146.1 hypothetical protein [Sphingomonas sp. BIUV-7]